jgi:hypothetical protein
MHGPKNVKFINTQQAKQIYQYKNIKEKLYKTNAAIWYNTTCRQKQLTPSYISIKINGNNPQCRKTIKATIHYSLNQELKFLYVKKQKHNEPLYKIHLECAFSWQITGISSNHQSTKNYNDKWKHMIAISTKIWTVYKPNNDNKPELHTTIRNSSNFTPE